MALVTWDCVHMYWGLAAPLSTNFKIFYLCLSMHSMAPYWGHFCNGCGLYANMPSHMRSHILRKSAYRILFRIYKLRFQNRICGNYAAYVKIRISSHISAYAMSHILHICHIFQCIISPNSIYFPHILHQNGPHILRKISALRSCVWCFFYCRSQKRRPAFTPPLWRHTKWSA